jgi:alpha-mannosidase
VTVTYELRAGDPKLYIHVTSVWFQRGTRETGVPTLRLAFPLALAEACGRYEIPFGAVDRQTNCGEEVPALNWAQVTGRCGERSAGCLLLNDSKHGHSLEGSTLRLTLIRSSYEPDILPEIGQHEVHVAVQPLAGELPVAEAIRLGQAFNHALRVIGTDVHGGAWPATGQFVRVAGGAVLSAIKKAEDRNAVVIRLFNPTRQKVTARFQLDAAMLGEVAEAHEVDLLERPMRESTAKSDRNGVSVTVPGHGIASVLVKLRAGRTKS